MEISASARPSNFTHKQGFAGLGLTHGFQALPDPGQRLFCRYAFPVWQHMNAEEVGNLRRFLGPDHLRPNVGGADLYPVRQGGANPADRPGKIGVGDLPAEQRLVADNHPGHRADLSSKFDPALDFHFVALGVGADPDAQGHLQPQPRRDFRNLTRCAQRRIGPHAIGKGRNRRHIRRNPPRWHRWCGRVIIASRRRIGHRLKARRFGFEHRRRQRPGPQRSMSNRNRQHHRHNRCGPHPTSGLVHGINSVFHYLCRRL